MSRNRLQKKSSRTAAYTCTMRAASYLDKNPFYRSGDFIAPMILPRFVRIFISIIKRFLASMGIYEYVIARTKYIDSVFQYAVDNHFDQVILFGAGFDSRAIRFLKEKHTIVIYEIDTKYTQEAKQSQFKKRNIQTPENLIYISVDLNREKIEAKLDEAGVLKNKTCLFILEGLIMYLEADAVSDLFRILYDYAGDGSRVVFDYIYASVVRNENIYFGEKSIHKTILNASEPWIFGIEKGEISTFLSKKGFRLIEHMDTEAMEEKYFTDGAGERKGRINGTHCLVLAEK
ncbi:MAG: class I SAM-dependent methyltransferase [Bacteroidales bacterium]|nr:class I SAM-dependent methyltransferase [Bacteroidales bacterium]